ncbi:MAG: Ig-like domain-containing protein [Clostridiales Family XIII bacterium]|nr:Ig-like domain-containing protein [Clostridiales Family XIII bacterium]
MTKNLNLRRRFLALVLTVDLVATSVFAIAPADIYATDNNEVISHDFIVPVEQKEEAPEGFTAITTPEELAGMTAGGKYILLNDIDLEDYNDGEWTPIGTSSAPFNGTLDGNGYVISNMHVDAENASGGLIGVVIGGELNISNIGIEGSNVSASSDVYAFAGGLIGYCDNSFLVDYSITIENSYNKSSVSSISLLPYHSYAGGLIGYCGPNGNAFITIENSYNVGDVEAEHAGGFLGNSHFKLLINNGYNAGTVTSEYLAGGFVSYSNNTSITVENSYNTGDILSSGERPHSGGFLGNLYGGSFASKNSYNIGTVSSSGSIYSSAGGIVSNSSTGSIMVEDSYNAGNVSSSSTNSSDIGGDAGIHSLAGGLIGINFYTNVEIENSYNSGDVLSSAPLESYAGGLLGYKHDNRITLENGYYKDNVLTAIGNTPDSQFVKALSDVQMKQQASYDGFDFDTIWQMPVAEGAPVLQSIPVDSNPVADTPSASYVEISGGNKISTLGGTLQLSAQVSPENARQKVNWAVNDTNLATINSTGLVTAKSNGSVKVTATAIDGSGFKDETAIIITGQKISVAKATIKDIAGKAYTGKALKPTPSVKVNGKTLKSGSDFTVKYKNNTNVGKATITITGKGNYTGTKTVSFKIVPKATSVSKVAPAKKQLKITWGKVSGTTKYEVRYRVKGTSKWTTKTVAGTSKAYTAKSLKKGKAYQVQVRSYKTVSGVKYYSAWSKTKTSGKVK